MNQSPEEIVPNISLSCEKFQEIKRPNIIPCKREKHTLDYVYKKFNWKCITTNTVMDNHIRIKNGKVGDNFQLNSIDQSASQKTQIW